MDGGTSLFARVAVHGLVDPLFRSGDLDDRVYNQETMAEGTRLHGQYQKSQSPDYLPEYPLEAKIEVPEGTISLFGRADGIRIDGGTPVIEEVKSTVADLDEFFAESEQWHLAQAKCYAYMYLFSNPKCRFARIRLVYISQLDSSRTMDKAYAFPFEELERDVKEMASRFLLLEREERDRKALRDASAKTLPFPFSEFRKGQRELAKRAYGVCVNGGRLFAEAPTGIGKTMSLLFPSCKAFAEGKVDKIFYLTAKNSGAEIAESSAVRLLDSGLSFRVSSIYSKDKVCLSSGHSCNPDDCPFAKGYYTKLASCLEEAKRRTAFASRAFLSAFCREFAICPFEFQLDLSLNSDLIIADYNYLFDPFVKLERYFGEQADPTGYVALVDESHNLIERGRMMYGARIGYFDALKASKSLGKGKIWGKIKRRIGKIADLVRDSCQEEPGILSGVPEGLREQIDSLKRVLLEIRKKQGGGMPKQARDFIRECTRTAKLLEGFYGDGSRFRLLSGGEKNPYIELYCLDPSQFISSSLLRLRGEVFFSATLSPIPFYEKSCLGEDSSPSLSLPSPFPKENMRLFFATKVSTRYKDRSASLPELSAYLSEFVAARKGNYFIFFPSYEYLRLAYPLLSFKGCHVYMQSREMGEEDKLDLLSKFESDPKESHVALLVLGGSFSEGIDLPDDRLIGVAVVGVGMPQIGQSNDLIREYWDKQGESGFRFAYENPGLNKVMQALGRLIRGEGDVGAALLIDDRYGQARYRDVFKRRYPNSDYVFSPSQLRKELSEFYRKHPSLKGDGAI